MRGDLKENRCIMIVQVCIGSSCNLKGSHDIVDLMKAAVEEHNLSDEVVLAGSFCCGMCSNNGVTIVIDDEKTSGVTKENFKEFFKTNILDKVSH